MIFADGIPSEIGGLATGVTFAGLVYFLLSKHIPNLMAAFREDLKYEREQRNVMAEKFNSALLAQQGMFTTEIRELRKEVLEEISELKTPGG